jgi:hypothetical protein
LGYSLVSRRTAEDHVWGAGCDAWHLLKSRRLGVIEGCIPPALATRARSIANLANFSTSFQARQSSEKVASAAGSRPDGVCSPRVRHQTLDSLKEPVQFLVISQPPSYGDGFDDGEPRK